ncbi:MAG: hypothetical protein IPJ65_38285 [Archangiaceae bacterium]|nr:hypothetical protein [Archangiaceae bacterium]
MLGMHEIRKLGSPDLLSYKKTLNRCEYRSNSAKTPEEALRLAYPAILKHWEKIGFVERWRVMENTATVVRLEGLLLTVVEDD